MPTQIYNNGYDETGDSGDNNHILHIGDAMQGVCAWGEGATAKIAIVSTAGVAIVNAYTHAETSYATIASGFNSVAHHEVAHEHYLYLGHPSGGVYKLTLTTSGTYDTGDITPGGWTAEYDTGSTPDIASNSVTSLALYPYDEIGGAINYLAVCCGGRLTIINMTAGASGDNKQDTLGTGDLLEADALDPYFEKILPQNVESGSTMSKALFVTSSAGLVYYFEDITTL